MLPPIHALQALLMLLLKLKKIIDGYYFWHWFEKNQGCLSYVGRLWPVLSDTEEVDDGVAHHGREGDPHKQDFSLCILIFVSFEKKPKSYDKKLTELIRPFVDHTEQLVSVDQLYEGGDVHRGLRCDEQHTEGDGQLVEPV